MVRIYGVTTTTSSGGGSGGGGNAPGVQLSGLTQSSGTVPLTTDGSGAENHTNIIVIPENRTAFLSLQIVARTEATPQKTASWNLSGLVRRESLESSVSIVGFSPVSVLSDNELSNLAVQLSENFYFGGISIRCTGIVDYTVIKWAATVTLTEV